jgi:ABC-type nickel/cobalt efflux system permease component RcnA
MDDGTTDLERATVQAPALERFLRTRLFNSLTRLFLVLVLVGGIISASTPGSHFLETASICLVAAVAVATWLFVRYLQLVRRLRTDPVREVAKLHKKRKIQKAGFVDATESSMDRPRISEHRYSDAPESDDYDALRDVDVLGQKSADGVNRTDDPSRGPIE